MRETTPTLSATAKHLIFCTGLFVWILGFCLTTKALRLTDNEVDQIDPWTEYGFLPTCMLVVVRLVSLLGLPQILFNLVGFVFLNVFTPGRVELTSAPLLAPFLCIRVVTRGLYPTLVKNTLKRNLETINAVGLENYMIEVVTDQPIGVEGYHKRVREVVVPSSYCSKSGALNKSRALQYCLEDDINVLNDAEDWILHLDEETLLTENAVRGVLNFICDGRHECGQGIITYAHEQVQFRTVWKRVQHRICTVADSFRVADDLGKLRSQFKFFHKPLFGWKGSYVVTKAGVERRVTYDNGPEGSKAEDAFFALAAMDNKVSFDFIEGEMHEKSPFTFTDFFKQRKRWMQGIYMVVMSPMIKWQSKIFMGLSMACWLFLPLSTLNLFLSRCFPFSTGVVSDFCVGLSGSLVPAMYAIGYVRQHTVARYSWFRLFLAVPELLLSVVLSMCAENIAVFTMYFGDWYDFYIVEKEIPEEHTQIGMLQSV